VTSHDAPGAVDGNRDAAVDARVDAIADVTPTDTAPDTSDTTGDGSGDAGCLAWSLGGIGVPAGTTATASATYSTFAPSNAIDGNLATLWNAPGPTASLTLHFLKPQAITGIRMAATSSPATMESYTVTASGRPTTIGSGTLMVNGLTPVTIEPAIDVTPGTYSGITIAVNGMASWAVINEVSLLTTTCP